MAFWNSFRSLFFGAAIGGAGQAAVEPQLHAARNLAWSKNQTRVLEADVAAQLAAEGLIGLGDAQTEGGLTGVNPNRVAALYELSQTAPGLAEALVLHRRGIIPWAQVQHALRKAKIEPKWDAWIQKTVTGPLDPSDLANAVQQGFVPNAGLLAGDTPGKPPFTPAVDEVNLDTLGEFQAGAIDKKHATVLAELVGLPPGVVELLQMWNRNIITETAVEHGIREGHTKTKWTSALKLLRWKILSGPDLAGLWLRGWLTERQAKDLAKLDGWNDVPIAGKDTAMDLLYKNRGRPATPRQTHLGYARGATLPGAANEDAALDRSVQESDIRTEWAAIEKANRWTYPSAFVIRQLTQSGAFNHAEALQILIESGWKPEYAKLAADAWAGPAASPTQAKWASRAQSRLFTATHRAYLTDDIDAAQATAHLETIGATAGEAATVLELWNIERAMPRRDLTPAQIKKAYKEAKMDLATATEALQDLGYTDADITLLLEL